VRFDASPMNCKFHMLVPPAHSLPGGVQRTVGSLTVDATHVVDGFCPSIIWIAALSSEIFWRRIFGLVLPSPRKT
jgi:hypothetical protein